MKNRKTNKKTVKYAAIALITILNLLVLLMWLGQLSFGHGLGDLSYLGFYTLLAVLGCIIVVVNKRKFVNIILIVVFKNTKFFTVPCFLISLRCILTAALFV